MLLVDILIFTQLERILIKDDLFEGTNWLLIINSQNVSDIEILAGYNTNCTIQSATID